MVAVEEGEGDLVVEAVVVVVRRKRRKAHLTETRHCKLGAIVQSHDHVTESHFRTSHAGWRQSSSSKLRPLPFESRMSQYSDGDHSITKHEANVNFL